MRNVPAVVELFCGCGGMSSGLLRAGYAVTLGIDANKSAIETYEHNHAHVGAKASAEDIREVETCALRERLKLRRGQPLVLTGGPPCQPFSIIGKQLALKDVRGDLVFEFLKLLKGLEPEAFIFENVANFARIEDGEIAERLEGGFKKADYATSSGILTASDYGVPQMRKRFFIIGVRGRRAPGLPPATHGLMVLLGQKPIVTCEDALGDLPDVGTPEASAYWNHEPTFHSAAMLEAFRHLRPGERDPKSHHDRLEADRPAYTIRAGFGNYSPLRPIHYRYDRVISVRESARIQSFPDSFVWPVRTSRLQQYRQVGNAVPPLLASAIGAHLADSAGFELDPERFGAEPEREAPPPARTMEEHLDGRRHLIRGASVGRPASVAPEKPRPRSRR
jgi:DNA (cytosine-5)-methyltransferase 1